MIPWKLAERKIYFCILSFKVMQMCFYDFSFIINLIRYSHCANYINVGVFFPYISVKMLCDL